MTMDREKYRDTELETDMYTNCLLLGLDPLIICVGPNNGTPRVGLFKHSNPKLGEQLLYFILSSLRGPQEFDKVWPIFDSAQSRDFRKVVQSMISELESQGAIPRCNSRVSSLATCCGPRFVELLWQLSLHALREVHRRTYAADVASNPLPAPLTDVALSHAASLLPVTKAKIALERRKFLKNAETAVQEQAMWSSLAHEMTAEYRGLCAEEPYLQHELEKLHDLWNKVNMEGEPWDELVQRAATCLWDSLLSLESQHEVLASGLIEDPIAHHEHRYRISGSTLLAAMDESSSSDEKTDRRGRGQPTVDIAEVIRRWTHAVQHIRKQTLQLANANDGEGPDLLRGADDGGTNGHAASLAAKLAEHRQLLPSIQVLHNQLKTRSSVVQSSISELTEEINRLSTNLPQMTNHHGRSSSSVQAQSTGMTKESVSSEITDVASRLSSVDIDNVSSSTAASKLPPLFSLTPNATAKSGNVNKSQTQVHTNQLENVYEKLPQEQTVTSNQANTLETDNENNDYIRNLKKSVREAALATRASSRGQLGQDKQSDDVSEHFFVPLSGTGFSRMGPEKKPASLRSKQLFVSETNSTLVQNHVPVEMVNEYDGVNGYKLAAASPPFLMDASLSADEAFEDLLAPLSETETALMVCDASDPDQAAGP